MRRSILPLTIFLPLLGAATAAAQMTAIRFVAPVNPISGLPKLFPSPKTGPILGTGITFPNLVPVFLPVRMPTREGQLPATPAQPSRDGVVNPLRRVMPDVVIRFELTPDAPKEKLDEAFDGEARKPAVELPRRNPVSSGRHVSLPEWDLERELGI